MFEKSYHLDYLTDSIVSKLNENLNDGSLIEFSSTKYIDINALKKLNPNIRIRITGPYTEKRYEFYKNYGLKTGRTLNVEHYKNSVIYSKNELIQIIEKIQELEKNISWNWSDLQKTMYIFEKLSSQVIYPYDTDRFNNKEEVYSLRGLINNQSICGGYALIFKEFMDRLGIENYYEDGYYVDNNSKHGHAWNIVKLNNKYYPLDLTYNSNRFMSGYINSTEDFASKDFYKNYQPLYSNIQINYKDDLSSIDEKYVNQIYSEITNDKQIIYNTVKFERNDKSEFILTQVNNKMINGKNYYVYYFTEIIDNKLGLPLLLYSDTNVMKTLNYDRYKEIIKDYEDIDITLAKDLIINTLFSLQNIRNSIAKKSLYIGNVNNCVLEKDSASLNTFRTTDVSINTRNDKTTFIIEKDKKRLSGINSYKYYDMDIIDNNFIVNMKDIHTENDFFKFKNKKIMDILLNKKHVDDCSKFRSGYLGMVIRKGFSLGIDYNFNSQKLLNNKNYVNYGEAKLLEDGKKIRK